MTIAFNNYIEQKLNSNDTPLQRFLYPDMGYYGSGSPIIPDRFWNNKSCFGDKDRWANSWGEVLLLAKQSLDGVR